MHSFCDLVFFSSSLSELMRICKGRASREGYMIKTSPAQNEDFYDIIDEFVRFYSFSLKLI